MKSSNIKKEKRTRQHARIRAKVSGTGIIPRLSVYKSNKHISVQLIDDQKSVTIASVHSREIKGKSLKEKSALVGQSIAEKALAKKVKKVVFDRGGFIYTGNVQVLADAARKAGLQF